MANQTNKTGRGWTTAELVAVYLPVALLGAILFGHVCCQFTAVKFDFPPVADRHRTSIESDSNQPTSKPATGQRSMTERVIDEDAVLDAVLEDLMREDVSE